MDVQGKNRFPTCSVRSGLINPLPSAHLRSGLSLHAVHRTDKIHDSLSGSCLN